MKEETIRVRWGVNISEGTEDLTLEDVECQTIEEWNDLSHEDQRYRIQTALNELPERVNIIVDSW